MFHYKPIYALEPTAVTWLSPKVRYVNPTDTDPLTLNFFLHFGQIVKSEKVNGRQGMHLKDFFFDMNPVALRKAKLYTTLAYLSAIGLKGKQLCFQKT